MGGQSNLLGIGLPGLVSPIFDQKPRQFWFEILQAWGAFQSFQTLIKGPEWEAKSAHSHFKNSSPT